MEYIPSNKQVGIDVGLKSYLTDSEGQTVDNPRHYRKAEKKLARLNRRLSRKKKKSANRKKARSALAKQHLKVQRQRKDFACKTANVYVSSHDLIAVRRVGACWIVSQRQKVESKENLLGHLPNLMEKPKGESSMVGKQINAKVCSAKFCESCSHGEAYTG